MLTIFFLDELINIDTRTGCISNVYLTASTADKIVFDTGPQFAPFGNAGHLLLINTALYGLKSYGSILHYCLSYALTALGFVPSVGVCNMWMHNETNHYAYVACYCDDLVVVHKDPDHVFDYILGKSLTIKEK